MKKNLLLNFALKNKKFYKLYLYYNLYIRNLKYRFKKSYSQFNEDIFLKKYFDKKKGFYIDIGCHHPFKGNDTFLLYKSGWSGLNIDLSKISIDLFKILRPRDINVNAVISNKKEKIKCYIPNNKLLSPEITISKKFSKILEKHHKNVYKSFKVTTTLWKSIEKRYKLYLNSVELLKIDIEGSDLKVLKTINLKKLKPKLIMIEASNFDKISRKKIITYLKSQNYKIIFDNGLNVIVRKKIIYR